MLPIDTHLEKRKIVAGTISCTQCYLIAKQHTNIIHCLHRLATNELEKNLGAKQLNIDARNMEARRFDSCCGTWAINDISFDDTFISYLVGGGVILDFHLDVLVSDKIQSERWNTNGCSQIEYQQRLLQACIDACRNNASVEIYVWYEVIFVGKM